MDDPGQPACRRGNTLSPNPCVPVHRTATSPGKPAARVHPGRISRSAGKRPHRPTALLLIDDNRKCLRIASRNVEHGHGESPGSGTAAGGVQKTGVSEHPAGAGFLKHGLVFNNPVQLSVLFNKRSKGLLSTLRLVAAGTLIGAFGLLNSADFRMRLPWQTVPGNRPAIALMIVWA